MHNSIRVKKTGNFVLCNLQKSLETTNKEMFIFGENREIDLVTLFDAKLQVSK